MLILLINAILTLDKMHALYSINLKLDSPIPHITKKQIKRKRKNDWYRLILLYLNMSDNLI